jgi:proline iminopeptidase
MPEEYITNQGVQIWTTHTGRAFPLLLSNGGPGCCDYLAPVAALLDDLVRVIRIEQRGCGRSQATPPYTLETTLADLERIREYYQVERWIVRGHSWGADLALIYALEYPNKVSGLVCISGGRMNNDCEWHDEYQRKMELEGEHQPDFIYSPNMEVNRQLMSETKRHLLAPLLFRRITLLEVPSLFVYGEKDI